MTFSRSQSLNLVEPRFEPRSSKHQRVADSHITPQESLDLQNVPHWYRNNGTNFTKSRAADQSYFLKTTFLSHHTVIQSRGKYWATWSCT